MYHQFNMHFPSFFLGRFRIKSPSAHREKRERTYKAQVNNKEHARWLGVSSIKSRSSAATAGAISWANFPQLVPVMKLLPVRVPDYTAFA